MSGIFLNKRREIRSGWKILLFFITFGISEVIFAIPPVLTGNSILAFQLSLLGATVLSTYIMMKFIEKKRFSDIGLWIKKKTLNHILLGTGIGLAMITMVVTPNIFLKYYTYSTRELNQITSALFNTFVICILVAFAEEMLFRGYPFQRLIDGVGPVAATLIFSLMFSLLHLGNPNINYMALLNIALAGVWLSVAYIRTGSLWLPISLHFSWNFFQGYLYSLPVSGVEFKSIFEVEINTDNLISGGKFGPEASILTSIVLIISTVFIIKSEKLKS
jgi:hypothetical protein